MGFALILVLFSTAILLLFCAKRGRRRRRLP